MSLAGSTAKANRRAPSKKSPYIGERRAAHRVLQACVVYSGVIIDKTRLEGRTALSIGTGRRNTFAVATPGLGRRHVLLRARGAHYELCLTESMAGKIAISGRPDPMDIDTLKRRRVMRKRGPYYYLPLHDGHRGKITIGDLTLLFEFVTPPVSDERRRMMHALRTPFYKRIDWPFASILLTVLMFELPFLLYFDTVPRPIKTLETIDQRWANLIAPDLKREKKKDKPPPTKTKDPSLANKEKKEEKDMDEVAKAKRKAERSKEIRKEIANRGMLAILGTIGEGSTGGAVDDVFSSGGINTDLGSAFEGISGVGIASGGGRTTRGEGTGDAASIGGLATSGGGDVGYGVKAERRVGTVEAQAPEVDGALDQGAINRVVSSRMRMVQDCYEKELKRNPNIGGKIEIEITIDEDGRVADAIVLSSSLGSDAVGSCIVGRVRRWRFPKPDGGSVTVTFPFIFTSSG